MQAMTYTTRGQTITITLDQGLPIAYHCQDSDNPGYRTFYRDFAEVIADLGNLFTAEDHKKLGRLTAKAASLIAARLAGDTTEAATRKLHRAMCRIIDLLEG